MKESVEPVEPIVENVEPKIEEKPGPPKKVNKPKEIVKCHDCNKGMTQHTLKHTHKRRGFCKADIKASPQPEKTVPEPVVQQNRRLHKIL